MSTQLQIESNFPASGWKSEALNTKSETEYEKQSQFGLVPDLETLNPKNMSQHCDTNICL